MHPSLTSFDFRYIQLAINVPTLSTLLYIWSDILNSTLSLFWASPVYKSSRIALLKPLYIDVKMQKFCRRIIPESLRWLLSKGKVIDGHYEFGVAFDKCLKNLRAS